MEDATRKQLMQISADFYRYHADSFDESRQDGWQAWDRVLGEVQAVLKPRSVLDLGCGNGRFAAFLTERGLADLSYTGIDSNQQLIRKAQTRHPDLRFEVRTLDNALKITDTYDVVVCFGVFHHLPDAHYRSDTLNALGDLVKAGGIAVISLWQPKLLKNFANKVGVHQITDKLDHDDFLLGWNGDFSHLRYCHHFDNDEIDTLVAQSRLELVTRFQGSGNDASNTYLILRRADVFGTG